MQSTRSTLTRHVFARAASRGGARSGVVAALGLVAALAAACAGEDKLVVDPDRPGASVIADIIACQDDSACNSGETCNSGFCQMRRCSDTYPSQPPLGQSGYAFIDRAFVTASTDQVVRAYSPSTAPDRAQTTVPATPLDVAGGNLTGQRPESFAILTAGSHAVQIVTPGGATKALDPGIQGKSIAAGDVNGDGVDEIVVASEGGSFAVCTAVKGTCAQGSIGRLVDDVAVGDIDGDGAAEILLVGANTLTVVNGTTLALVTSQPVTANLAHIAAGDIDGDGKAEIFGTESGTLRALYRDRLYVYRFAGQLIEDASVDLERTFFGNDALDVAYAKIDNKPTIGVLATESKLQAFEYGGGSLRLISEAPMPGGSARRLAAADVNGRSAAVRLKAGPKLEVGPPVPIAVLTLPPYSATYSQGPSSATMGTTEEDSTATSHGRSKTSSVSLMLGGGITLGTTAGGGTITNPTTGTPMPAGGIGLSASLSAFVTGTWASTVSRSVTKTLSRSVGNSYTVNAEPQVDGWNSGAVVLGGGCFHRYDYAIDDPGHVLETEANVLSTHVPVGGETSLWSTRRYNALVDALADGRLPKIAIPSKLGSVSSYPKTPVTLDGKPIPAEDNVFPHSPNARASDVGTVGFSLTSSDSTTNTDATAFNYSSSISAALNVNISVIHANGQVTQDTSLGLDQSYSVTLGTSASFSGQISPVRDDPQTPGNEAKQYGYSFRPIVYRHHFKEASGQNGAFYVLTYAVGK